MRGQTPDSADWYREVAGRLRGSDEPQAATALGDLARDEIPGIVRQLRPRFLSLGTHDWEDIVQEALDHLWNHRDRIDPERFSRGYLYRALRNAAIDWIRSRRRQVSSVSVALQPEHLSPKVSRTATRSPLQEDLERILGHFSLVDRTILRAYAEADGQGDWAAQVARDVGLKAGTVRVRKLRSLQRIRRMLSELGYEGVDKRS